MNDREEWDPVMLEEYLAAVELGVDGEQVLELRRRVLSRSLPLMIRGYGESAD